MASGAQGTVVSHAINGVYAKGYYWWKCNFSGTTGWVAESSLGGAAFITQQPTNQTVLAGGTASFTVGALGAAPLSYQWRFNGTNLAGATTNALTLTNVQVAQAGTYTVQVTNAYGSVLSSNAVLTVLDPWIVGQPQNQSVAAGAPATFTVSAVGTLPLSYQWLKEGVPLVDGTNISGALTATLTVAQVQVGDMGNVLGGREQRQWAGGQFECDAGGELPSRHPDSAGQPDGFGGSVVAFTAGAAGTSPLSFHWQRAGTNLADGGKISGSATASLSVSNVQAGEMGRLLGGGEQRLRKCDQLQRAAVAVAAGGLGRRRLRPGGCARPV